MSAHRGYERVAIEVGERSGVTMAVAVHSTELGPALGGARLWHYHDAEEGLADAKRLAAAMTLKASAAGLDLGGGKAVICAPEPTRPEGRLRRDLLLDFGDLVESLGGDYITAEDVGTDADDMAVIAERTDHVTGLAAERGGSGDPSPVTALGVLAAIHGCAERRFGTRELAGRRVVIVGLGHVGSHLARLLIEHGARLAVSDIDPTRRATAAEIGAQWIDPAEAMTASCDVLAPCALGGAIDAGSMPRLRCAIVCGAANNVLAEEGLAERLADAGILYAPDFIVNAGGLINVYRELHGYDAERALELARGIEGTVSRIVAEAEARGVTPLSAARALAARRLDAAAATPPEPPRTNGKPKRGLFARRPRLGATLAR